MTKVKKKMSKVSRKRIQLMAATVLSVALLSGQVMPVTAGNNSAVVQVSSIIPDNITIETPVSLSEISLPKSDYGKLSWADDSQIPSRRSEAFKVIFRPSDDFDLSRVELSEDTEWDEEQGVLTSYVTVVVSSISRGEETGEAYDESESYEYEEEAESQDDTAAEELSTDEKISTENPDGEAMDSVIVQEESEAVGSKEQVDVSDSESDTAIAEEGAEEAEENAANDPSASSEAENTEAVPEEKEENTTDSVDKDSETSTNQEEAVQNDGEESSDKESSASSEENGEETIPDNIFDRADEEMVDNRPVIVEENLTEEEQERFAQENHSCDGIFVSGIHLPWYVQFRATSGESYEFSNESQANIFRSYEFELWDLKNDTEYEIPDGEYISVTIPVKEGYEYTIEHLLDNGAVETIIPSVVGNIMTFSTHSFSPFGIAGSKTLIGEGGMENNYTTPTPTAVPTRTPTKAPSNSGTNGNTGTSGNSGSTETGGTNSNNGTGSANTGTGGTNNQNGTGSSTGNSSSNNETGSNTGNSGTGNTAVSEGNSSGNNGSSTEQNNGSAQQTDASNQNSSGTKAVQTGDNTQILPFVILVIAAVMIIAAVLFLKKKKK